jgi:ribosome-associated translation inhibitor RaiA
LSKIHVVGETRAPKVEVEKAVNDHLQAKLAQIERNIADLQDADSKLTHRHRMGWEEFKARLQEGKLDEKADLDFIEWESTVELLRQLRRERDMLKDALE